MRCATGIGGGTIPPSTPTATPARLGNLRILQKHSEKRMDLSRLRRADWERPAMINGVVSQFEF
ncbi:MAG: hypothetical protein H7293_19365 [Candidatus Saccharibacteria bacterium]|nr:hypothetical protein [Rhodoferax sp.]